MRIASSLTLRIAAGLLLAALLSIVGYKVFRRSISHGPEALPERADDSLWLASLIHAQPIDLRSPKNLIKPHPFSTALHAIVGRMHARIKISSSIPNANLVLIFRRLLAAGLVRQASEQVARTFQITHLRTAA